MLKNSLLIACLLVFASCSEDQTTKADEPESESSQTIDSTAAVQDSSEEDDSELYHEVFDSSQLSDALTPKINPLIEDYPADSINPAQLKWDVEHHDFGPVIEGESPEYDFHFTNSGKSPLVISEAYSSCGCTIPSFPMEPILPGKRATIHVRFNSEGKEGNVFKRIVVLANTYPEKANVVSISCQVEKNK